MAVTDKQPSWRRWRRGLAVVVVLLAGLLAGLAVSAVVRGAGRSPGEPSAARPAPVPTTDHDGAIGGADDAASRDQVPAPAGPGPWSEDHGVGVGFERSEAGAVAAGVSYATAAQSWLYLSDDDLAAAAEAVIVPAARSRLVGRLVDDVRLLRDELTEASGTVWYVVAPLATSLDTYDPSRAVVRVWIVGVLAADGVAVPQSSWRTLTLHLEWSGGDWRVADVDEADGPTPQLEAGAGPWSAAYLGRTLSGFVRVGVR